MMRDDLNTAGEALQDLVEGPGLAAAEALQAAFEEAGLGIETALVRAAQSGEAEFRRMAESVLADLARIAAETVFAQTQLTGPAPIPGARPGDANALSQLIAAAALQGQRFL